jgi:guanylate kinase
MKKRTILCGKAGSGKDYFRKKLESRGFSYGISYTTRTPRAGEVDGKDYWFLSREDFISRIDKDFFYEYVEFNGWYYGTSNEQFFVEDDVFIMTPHGISLIKPEDRKTSLVIFLDIPMDIRRDRLHLRNDNNDSIERRIQADELDFQDFTDFDIRITNHNF